MNGIQAFLEQFDHAWGHKWESLQAALDGVGEDAAAWQAACYADDEREEGWPRPGSIHWQVAHVAHYKRHYTDFIRRRGETERPPVTPRRANQTFAEELAGLTAAHTQQREAISGCTDDDLDVSVGNGMPLHEFLSMCIRHDAWHASQIAVARRLYRKR